MALTAAEREAAHRSAQTAAQRLERLTTMHRQPWPPPKPIRVPDRAVPPAPARPRDPQRPPVEPFAQRLLADIPRWRMGERRVARELAGRQAGDTHRLQLEAHQAALGAHEERVVGYQRELVRLDHEREAEQRLLDLLHKRLLDGDPPTNARAIDLALKALPFAARHVAWHDRAALVALSSPGIDTIPEREPDWTAAGKPTTRKLNQTERNDRHAEVTAALTIAAARRALAAGPRLPAVVCAALDGAGRPLAHCRVSRSAPRPSDDAITALYEFDGDLEQSGRTRQLAPLGVGGRRDVEALIAATRGR